MAYTTINKSSEHFNTLTYTGDGSSSRNITGVGFQPDLLWIKNRNAAQAHFVFDAVRGVSKAIFPNNTSAESTQATTQTAFLSDGFTVGNDAASNGNGNGIASWNWKANGAGSSNTAGSTATTVSVNTTAGFSIGTYTGTSSVATMGHGLGAVPGMIIVKNLSSGTRKWAVWHQDLSSASKYLSLNETSAELNDSAVWNNTLPTNLVFSSAGSGEVNQGSQNFVFYAFTGKQGYSKFGSYVGNASTDGTFVYTGFKPAFVMMKNTSNATSSDWLILDNKRNTFNPESNRLNANTTSTDISATWVNTDFLSNGFKLKTSDETINESGNTFIYMAFAEAPLVGTNGVTAKAR